MKKTAILLPLLVAALTGCNNAGNSNTPNANKADSTPIAAAKPEAPPPPMDSAAKAKKAAEEMKIWMDYMTPGNMQKMMASWDGKWTEETTLWMGDGAQPQKSTGICENKMLLGGRYQQSTHKGSMMGMPFEGIGMMGYDNAKKVFVSSWMDNFGTGMMYTEGAYDSSTKTITLMGKVVDPLNGKEKLVKQLLKIIDDKHQVIEMYEPAVSGKEFKSLEIKFTRK